MNYGYLLKRTIRGWELHCNKGPIPGTGPTAGTAGNLELTRLFEIDEELEAREFMKKKANETDMPYEVRIEYLGGPPLLKNDGQS